MSHFPSKSEAPARARIELTQAAQLQWSKMAALIQPGSIQLDPLVQVGDLIAISDSFHLRVDRRTWRTDDNGVCHLHLRLDWPGETVPR